MTNTGLGFLLQELGKKCWELSLNRGAVSWKPWVSREKQTWTSVTSFLLSKACPALLRKAEGQNLQHPNLPGDSRAAGLSCSAQDSPDTIPGKGERHSSLSIPVTSSSSHTAGNYLGWDQQLGKQEKEMGPWWATPAMVCCHLCSSFLLGPKASLGCLWESRVVQTRTCCGCNFETHT